MAKHPVPPHRPPTADASAPVDLVAWPAAWVCPLIFAVAFVIYFPALNGALLWDDASHVTRPELRSLAGLFRIWSEPGATQQYYPLLHSAFWLEAQLWALCGLWFARRRGLLAAGLLFCGSLFPALGFIDIYPFVYSFVADHFQYLPSLGIFAALGAGLALAVTRWPVAARTACAALLMALAGLS